ncbi:putative acylneuraminate cytidylyltransferase [Selenomonas ruminantium subsp. lactilytica TAM6421]|uniref:Putative acylneuraminate cytidylyltransferase n=1 Tax=Selenomonas ruminantium subsp. lactilytica (strain NBRC 103574 / TAM6421) TaxID=927704 RepID=I0GTJ4_SELRL|nr:pseudaminic acid cytidylyltransferase [Selenomonas ruminantium]BAL84081.1 putative acylneuraminate cytidylyltransferase [Selenomonas ruminantium subsp. lactilytica TAM6421]
MSAIAIIPARGGSKRIPRKNIRSFCGKPIIAYSIIAALESNLFEEVIVSTDDTEIADISQSFGAQVPFFRSDDTSDDCSTVDDVLREVLDAYRARGRFFQEMCCLYATAPFVSGEKLRQAHKILSGDIEQVLAVAEYSFPPQRSNVIRDGYLVYAYPEFYTTRSQDLEPVYHDAGQFAFYRLSDEMEFRDDRIAPYILPELEVQDIDNPSDWKLAELKFQLMQQKE